MVKGFFKKYRIDLLLLTIFTLIYFISRFSNIFHVPIFTDEALYVRWAQIASQDASWRFISLTDGKQPLFIWFTVLAMRFIEDPLLAGRIVSIFAGFFSMVGLYFLGKQLFVNKWVGIFSAFLYVIYPFALVYDRMALYDSLVGTFAVWGMVLAIMLVRSIRLDIALILGIVSGIAVLNKSNGFFTVYLLPLTLFLFPWKQKNRKYLVVKWLALAVIVTVLTYGIYSILRLSPFFHIIEQKNAIFVYPLKEWLQNPFAQLQSNSIGLTDWLVTYLSYPFVFAIFAAFFIKKSYTKEKVFLFLWFLAPFTALVLFGRTIYPRYLLFMTYSLIPLIAYTLYELRVIFKKSFIYNIVFLGFIIFPLYTSFLVITNFKDAPIPRSDRTQYYTDWPAGIGIKESTDFFREKAKHGKIYIATQGTFGLMPYAYEIYLVKNPNITLKGYWPIHRTLPDEVLKASKEMPTYYVFYQPCDVCLEKGQPPSELPLVPVFTIKKDAPNTTLTIYQVKTP